MEQMCLSPRVWPVQDEHCPALGEATPYIDDTGVT